MSRPNIKQSKRKRDSSPGNVSAGPQTPKRPKPDNKTSQDATPVYFGSDTYKLHPDAVSERLRARSPDAVPVIIVSSDSEPDHGELKSVGQNNAACEVEESSDVELAETSNGEIDIQEVAALISLPVESPAGGEEFQDSDDHYTDYSCDDSNEDEDEDELSDCDISKARNQSHHLGISADEHELRRYLRLYQEFPPGNSYDSATGEVRYTRAGGSGQARHQAPPTHGGKNVSALILKQCKKWEEEEEDIHDDLLSSDGTVLDEITQDFLLRAISSYGISI